MAAHLSEERLNELVRAGRPVRVRYTGTSSGRIIAKEKANGLSKSYSWHDHEGHITEVEAADLEALFTLPGGTFRPDNEFEVVDDTKATSPGQPA